MTYNLKKLTLTDAHDSQEISLGKDKFQLSEGTYIGFTTTYAISAYYH
jgi:hypothetical protein